MKYIYETKLRFQKKKNPNFWVRVFSFLRYPKVKIGFIFNYRAFLYAYSLEDDLEEKTDNETIGRIVYGAAIEWCIEYGNKVFFNPEDIQQGLMRASLKTNEEIGKAMSYAQMPDWLNEIVENLPQEKQEGIKKKQQ